MRVIAVRLDLEQVDNIDEANLQIREFLTQHRSCRQCLLRWNVTSTRHYHIWFLSLIVAGLRPDPNSFCAMRYRRIHVQVLKMVLLVAHDYVDVVLAAQAMISNR